MSSQFTIAENDDEELQELTLESTPDNRPWYRKRALTLIIGAVAVMFLFLVVVFIFVFSGPTRTVRSEDNDFDVKRQLSISTVGSDTALLSSDAYEGRGTGTRGEVLAVSYIAGEMSKIGLESVLPKADEETASIFPGSLGSYVMPVPLLGTRAKTPTLNFNSVGDVPAVNLKWIEEFTLSTDTNQESIDVQAQELVYVGFGIIAPEWNWDSFKDVDVRGKVLLSLVNDPGHFQNDIFNGNTLTYYGRWTYKIEEARRQGARGLIMIHTNGTAGYPFSVLQHDGEHVSFGVDDPLQFVSWISSPALGRVLNLTQGLTLDSLIQEALSPDFKPRSINVKLEARAEFNVRNFHGYNTYGVIRGTEKPEEYVLFTAHHDHLGIGLPDSTGDDIYNGALDNAVGVSAVLSIMRALASGGSYSRSIIFSTVTAEEKGLVGSDYLAKHPVIENKKIVANINFDGCNIFGRTTDIVGIGAEKSELDTLWKTAVQANGLTVSPDPHPNQGSYFRSDQLSFARGGIPGLLVGDGSSFVGHDDTYADQVFNEYNENHYHQPSDEFDPNWDLAGCLQQMEVAVDLGLNLANSDLWPKWKSDAGFHR